MENIQMFDNNLAQKNFFLSDKELHHQFQQLAYERNKITYKLLHLIPEIQNREIYKQYGYPTIHVYAARIAGISPDVVSKVLWNSEKLKDKPKLLAMVEKVGIHKVAMVATIANRENEAIWAEKVQNMSKKALTFYTKEFRQTKSFAPTRAADETLRIDMDREMQIMFYKLKKEIGGGLSNKDVLREVLKKVCEKKNDKTSETGVEKKSNNKLWITIKGDSEDLLKLTLMKEKIIQKMINQRERACGNDRPGTEILNNEIGNTKKENREKSVKREKKKTKISRQPSKKKKTEVYARSNGVCQYSNCSFPVEEYHHLKSFSKSKSHESLIGVCSKHHELLHQSQSETDKLYRKYKMNGFLKLNAKKRRSNLDGTNESDYV